MRFDPRPLPCGCARCGCVCESHSASGVAELCARHGLPVVARWIAGEVLALVAIGLLIASIAVWGAISSAPGPLG